MHGGHKFQADPSRILVPGKFQVLPVNSGHKDGIYIEIIVIQFLDLARARLDCGRLDLGLRTLLAQASHFTSL